MSRCVNIDWLEVYCLEDAIGFPHNADFFKAKGWEVREREYGTPMYREMFTLYDHFGEPFIEIRRNPKSDNRKAAGIFDPYSSHVRLSNRSCYLNNAAQVLDSFLQEHGFAIQRISRIDLCLDFEKFDYGDEPQRFVQRFMAGRYSKINQANISAHGLDQWDGRFWNSLSWGSKKSMVTTKFYNKTMELRQVHDKPYIRQAWAAAGLVDDALTLEKRKPDGTVYKPEIWRVEFSIKSSTKKWFVVEDYNGDRKQLRSMSNTLPMYYTREQLFQVFLSLAKHYFHFKKVEYKDEQRTELQRKDRCEDKRLFREDDLETFYQLEKLATATPRNPRLDSLLNKLYEYRERCYDDDVRNACNVIIAQVERTATVLQLARPFDETEIEILQRIIAVRLKSHDVPFSVAKQEAEAFVRLEHEIWKQEY